jgi:hypothetical protein
VPVRVADGSRLDWFDRGVYRAWRYRPRVEGGFARIERWQHRATGDAHWRVTTGDNVMHIFGRSARARIADPDNPRRVFSWLLEETRDDRGNLAVYRYKAEDGAGVARHRESVRFGPGVRGPFLATAQRYLKEIVYGNRAPIGRDEPAPSDPDAWLFEVVFDYGEHDEIAPSPAEARPWPVRSDPFSTRRPTFEVRTYRQCRRILGFHRIPALGTEPVLVRSTDFTYEESRVRSDDGRFTSGPVASYLTRVAHAGYRRDDATGALERQALPPLDLGYSQPVLHDRLRLFDPPSLAGLPTGLVGTAAQWVDLDGEGLPGVLVLTPDAWYYKRNRGGGRLGAPVLEAALPAGVGAQQLVDLGGDGNLDLVRYAPPVSGYQERIPPAGAAVPGGWKPLVGFEQLPNLDWSDPHLRFLDLDGDGHPDVLVTEEDAFTWYRAKDGGKDGFEPARRVDQVRDTPSGARLVFGNQNESIHLADMTGDGLIDLVLVTHGQVAYFPNLGFGRFGKKIALTVAFDSVYDFDPRRVRLADVDGSGAADVLYAGARGVEIYVNEAGNRLSGPFTVRSLPLVDTWSGLEVVDLLGTGAACLIYSTKHLGTQPMAFVDLLAGEKPHLLTSVVNNLGAETRVAYAPSTRFYLADRAAGRPWLTRLPFPVHVVERIEVVDHVAGTRRLSRLAYHTASSTGASANSAALPASSSGTPSRSPARAATTSPCRRSAPSPGSRTTPDASETLPTYNEAGLLERIDVRVRDAAEPTAFVANVDYNARGKRERIDYGNGTATTYAYDPLTFRLIAHRTVRTSGGAVLHDLAYVYDAVGNITQITDAVSFGNPAVAADGLYTYDATYQLVEAEGREHPGQQPTDADPERLRLDHPQDMQALRRYRERYAYDPAGNITEMAHVPLGAGPPGWTRQYRYAADSNRLVATSAPGDLPGQPSQLYTHDAAGNMSTMPHLVEMRWDHTDRFQRADRGGGKSHSGTHRNPNGLSYSSMIVGTSADFSRYRCRGHSSCQPSPLHSRGRRRHGND